MLLPGASLTSSKCKKVGREPNPMLKSSLNKRDVLGWQTWPFSDMRVSANWKTWQNFLFALPVWKSRSGSWWLCRCLLTLLCTSQGWLATWRAVALPESDRWGPGARLQCQIAIVLVKCLTVYETKGMQKWESGPVGSDEVHWTCGEKPASFSRRQEKNSNYLRNKTLHMGCLGRAEVIWSLTLCIIILWRTW